jgi:small subunit ribosomal protein S9
MVAAKVAHAAGKRKEAVARATARPGKGIVRINATSLDVWGNEFARMRVQEPLMIAGPLAAEVDIDVTVFGGGWSSQAEAARLAIAKSLITYTSSEELRKMFLDYDRFLLVADTRRKEPRKFGTHSRARAKRQTSYR